MRSAANPSNDGPSLALAWVVALLAHVQSGKIVNLLMANQRKLTLDWWSVIAALGAAALIRLHILPHIPW